VSDRSDVVDDVQEDDVEELVDDLDLPGSGDVLERRREVVLDLYRHLEMEGSARRSEFLRVIESSRDHGYQDADSFWSNVIKGRRSLGALPGVRKPPEGGHRWRFDAGDVVD